MKTAFRTIALIILLAAGLALTHISRAQDATPEATPSPDATAEATESAVAPETITFNAQDMKLLWNDEFDGAEGTAINSENWTCEIGGDGWGNNELEYYTTGTNNASLDGNGSLAITARQEDPDKHCWYGSCTNTSARCNTQGKVEFTYGLVEARIKIPEGQGIWPAFWMLGANIRTVGWPDSGELDIMENIGKEPQMVHGTAHGPGYAGAGFGDSLYLKKENYADNYHVFALDWEADGLNWYMDDRLYFTLTKEDLGDTRWVFDHDFFILLNVAVGGNWPGNPDKTTVFPQTMKVDYVRVYQLAKGS